MVLLWTAVQLQLVYALQNWNLQRTYPPLHSRRTQGFTEDWGIENDEDDEDEEETSARESVDTTLVSNPPSRLILVQFRPAWMEQLALRVADIDFTVHNSRYPVTERTGPLPYLQSLDDASPPVMVGRFEQRSEGTNAIFAYLQQYFPRQTASFFDTSSNPHTATTVELILRHRLPQCLAVTRYNAPTLWEQVQRPLMAAASLVPGAAYTDRLLHRNSSMTLDQALETAQQAYAWLDEELQEKQYILGTSTPTYLDCELVDHVLHALADVELGPLVPAGVQRYVQRVWDKYLGDLLPVHRTNVFGRALLTRTMWLGDSTLALASTTPEKPPPLATPDPWATWRFWTLGAEPTNKHERDNELWVATVLSGTLLSMWWMGWARSS